MTQFLGLDKITDPADLPWGALQTLENMYVQNGRLVSRQGRANSPFTLEAAGGGTGEIVDIYNHEGFDGNTILLATNRNLYSLKAKHLEATATSVDNKSVSNDNCVNPQWLFEITEDTVYIQFYVTTGETPDVIRGYKLTVGSSSVTIGSTYTDYSDNDNDIEAAWFTQTSATSGLFFYRTSAGLYVVAFTYDSTTDTITWGSRTVVDTGADDYCIKGTAKTDSNKAIVVWAEDNSSTYTMMGATVSISGTTCTVANNASLNWAGLDSAVMDSELINSDCKHLKSGRIIVTSKFKTSGIYTKAQVVGYIGTQMHISPTYDFTGYAIPQPRIIVMSPNDVIICGSSAANALVINRLEIFTAQIQLVEVILDGDYALDASRTTVNVRSACQLNDQQIIMMSRSSSGGTPVWDVVIFGVDTNEITYLTYTELSASPSVTDFTHYGLERLSDTRILHAWANLGATQDPAIRLINITSEYQSLQSFTTWYRRLDMASFNNRLVYIANEMIKTDLDNVWNIGITAPNTSATLATSTATGTLMDGVYDYIYTYYNSTWGIESGPSPISAEIEVLLDQQVTLSALTTTSDSQVDKIRIYRRKVSIGQTLHFHVEDIAVSNDSYVDDTPDISVSQLIIAPEVDGTPPTAQCIENHKDRMWYAAGTLLYYSELGRPDIVNGESYLIVGGSGDITALVSFLDNLVIFKENSIWLLTGDSIESFELIEVVGDQGAFNHRCALKVDNVIFHADHSGVHAFDGRGSNYLSRQIEPLWLELQNLTIKEASIATDSLRGLLCITGSVTSTSQFDTVFCFNYRNPGWSTWPVDTIGVIAPTLNKFGESKLTYGRINRFGDFEGTTELGGSLTWTAILGNLTFPDAMKEQWLKDIKFITSRTTDTATATIGYFLDGDISTLTTKNVSLKNYHIHYIKGDRRCEKFTPYITGDDIPVNILQFDASGGAYGWR